MARRYSWPEGHWGWPIGISHKHGLRAGDMIWVGGQVDLTPEGAVRHPGDLAAQTRHAIAYFGIVLEDLGASLTDLVKLLCFYVNDGSVDEDAFLAMVAEALPDGARPAVTAVPVPWLAYPDMVVEIEGIAMRGADGAVLPRSYATVSPRCRHPSRRPCVAAA
jgi:enamine deaminase RidA (YjgF/YER057c/UK114 family)